MSSLPRLGETSPVSRLAVRLADLIYVLKNGWPGLTSRSSLFCFVGLGYRFVFVVFRRSLTITGLLMIALQKLLKAIFGAAVDWESKS